MKAAPAWMILFAVAIAAAAVQAAQAQQFEMHSVAIYTDIEDADHTGTKNIVVACTDAVLVYGLELFIPYNDASDRYAIYKDSMRLGVHALEHDSYVSGDHGVDVSLLEGGDGPSLKYPLLVPRYSPLVVPVQVRDSVPGQPVEAILDVTYAGNAGAQCGPGALHGPQRVGLLTPTGGSSVHINTHTLASASFAVEDYNRYLAELGEQWWLELVIKDSQSDPGVSSQMVRELKAEGIRTVIGPAGSSSVAAVYDYTRNNDMLVVSCCSTAPYLALPDHVFRMSPDDTNQARALAAVMANDGIDTVAVIHRDDIYGHGLSEALAESMAERGGIVAHAMPYPTAAEDLDAKSHAALLASTVQDLVDVNGAERVAVMAVSYGEVEDIAEASMAHPVLNQIKWYGSESVVNRQSMTEGDLGDFSDKVRLAGVIHHVLPNPLNTGLAARLADALNLAPDESVNMYSYSVYDAVLVLANAMLATQSLDTDALVEALPHIFERTFGSLNGGRFNENGDLAMADYGVWEVHDRTWLLAGTYAQTSDTVVEDLP